MAKTRGGMAFGTLYNVKPYILDLSMLWCGQESQCAAPMTSCRVPSGTTSSGEFRQGSLSVAVGNRHPDSCPSR